MLTSGFTNIDMKPQLYPLLFQYVIIIQFIRQNINTFNDRVIQINRLFYTNSNCPVNNKNSCTVTMHLVFRRKQKSN